jgi:thrombospondin 2/3/4/5
MRRRECAMCRPLLSSHVPDNCPDDENSDQADSNDDGIGDACEDATDDCGIDADGDDIGDVSESGEWVCDNCPGNAYNPSQDDSDFDGVGDEW